MERWRVLELLGRGGMGTVWLAERADGEYAQRAALKRVAGGWDAERFRTERQVLARLDHPNIARLLDGGLDGEGRPYLVMELVDGSPITEHCADLPLDERLRLFRVVCEAVQHAHGKLVVHRDLKPANTFVTRDGQVKLLDFGIAKLLEPAALGVDAAETRELPERATPGYAAPEQLLGGPIGTATDVWSLGVLLFELVSGRRPFELDGKSAVEVERALAAPPPRLIGTDLDSVVARALRREPERRYASAGQLGEEIDRYLAGLPVLARPDSLAYRARRFAGRNRAAVAAAAGAAVALVAFAAIAAGQARRAAAERDAAELEREKAERVVGLLVELFETSNPGAHPEGDRMPVRDFLALAQPRALDGLADQPEVRAKLRQVFGMIFAARDQYDEARAALEAALEEQRRLLGPDHPDAIETLYQLGRLFQHTGDRERGVALLTEALERCLRALGEEHEKTARALVALADPARLEEGGALIRRALAIRRRVLPPNHPQIAENLGMLAQYHHLRGERRRADELYREALAVFRTPAERRHPSAILLLNDYANVLGGLGRDAEAELLLRESMELARAVFGDESFHVALRQNNLAVQLARRRRMADAEREFREAHARHVALLGEDHLMTANVARNVAAALSLQGRQAEALAWIDRALAATAPARHVSMFHMLGRRASILMRLGRREEAVRIIEEAVAGLAERIDEPPHARPDLDDYLAQILVEVGRARDAEAPARRAVVATADLPYDHPRRATADCTLAWALLESGRDAEGRALAARCLPAFRAWGLTEPVVIARLEEALAR